VIQIGGELRDPQVICAKGNDHVARNRFVTQLEVLPDCARRAQDFLGDEQGVLYLVMPFIEGGTLTGYLRRHLPDIHEVSTIFLQLLDAVEYAHDEINLAQLYSAIGSPAGGKWFDATFEDPE